MSMKTQSSIFVLTAQPRAGKTTLAELVKAYGLAKIADISNQIHQQVFNHYKVPLSLRDDLKGSQKEIRKDYLGGQSFREACIAIGDFNGDRYQAEFVRAVHQMYPDERVLVPSLKNQFTLDYLASIVSVPLIVVGITRKGLPNVKDTRSPLKVDFTINNDGSKKYLFNQFKHIVESHYG